MTTLGLTLDEASALRRENELLQRAVQELSLLNDLALSIGALRESSEIQRVLINRSLKAVGAQQGMITLVSPEDFAPNRTLVRAMPTAPSTLPAAAPFHLTDAILEWIELNRRPLMVNDPASDARFSEVVWDDEVRSLLAVPLMVKGQVNGVLAVYNKTQATGFDEGDQRLLSIIAAQSAQIIENARLREEESALVSMREQVKLAADVQQHLLPAALPAIDGYEVSGSCVAAQDMGGDYFDVIRMPRGRWAVCIGDVSGKGIPASLLMSNVQAMIRLLASGDAPISETLSRANDLLVDSTPAEKFVTFFHSILDPAAHILEFGNAGHNPPLLIRGNECRRLWTRGAVLGALKEFRFAADSTALEPGDVVVLYSDGVTEAVDGSDEEFGEERLVDLVQRFRRASAGKIRELIMEAVNRHAAGRPPHDDITLLVLKRLPSV